MKRHKRKLRRWARERAQSFFPVFRVDGMVETPVVFSLKESMAEHPEILSVLYENVLPYRPRPDGDGEA